MLRRLFGSRILFQNLVPARNYCLAPEPAFLSDERIKKIAKNDPDLEKKLKVLVLEVDFARQEGKRSPDPVTISDDKWEHILGLSSRSARQRYYSFLWQSQIKHENDKAKKEKRRQENLVRITALKEEAKNEKHIVYALNHVSMFMRIYDKTIDHWNNGKLIRAMQYNPKLIIDCSYDSYMTNQEASNAAKQFMLSFAENRNHDEPFDLHFCNVDLESYSMKVLMKFMPSLLDPAFPVHVHKENVTEVFPRERLVYLTPHCRTDLNVYNPDDIYIIGGMVDKAHSEPLSLAKAKRLGIRMARFPLDRYLQWKGGSGKSLTVNQALKIMLDIKETQDWNKALSIVPRRKVVTDERELKFQNRQRNIKQLNRFKFSY